MALKTRKCLSCETSYEYCPNCSRADKLAPAWKAQFCSEPCATLWATLTKFGMNRLTKSEAKDIISSLDLKPIDYYVACVQRDYAKVMEPEKKSKRGKRIEIKPIDEVMEFDPEVVEPIIEEVIDIKSEQPIEVAEQAEEAAHEVVYKKENE